jgi:hypothetical protein
MLSLRLSHTNSFRNIDSREAWYTCYANKRLPVFQAAVGGTPARFHVGLLSCVSKSSKNMQLLLRQFLWWILEEQGRNCANYVHLFVFRLMTITSTLSELCMQNGVRRRSYYFPVQPLHVRAYWKLQTRQRYEILRFCWEVLKWHKILYTRKWKTIVTE